MPSTPTLEHRFNDDLLTSLHDQKLAKDQYSEIFHILDYPELRGEFLKYDRIATRARLRVQRFGLLAVLLTVLALLGSATTPLLHQLPNIPDWVFTVSFWAEIGGLFGVIIASGGMWIAGNKKKWLEARMMAEILRIWHFQAMIRRGSEIELSCVVGSPSAHDTYRKARNVQLQKFLREWGGSPDSHLMELIENPEAGYQVLHDNLTNYSPNSAILEKILIAYKSMRFRHQVDFAAHKLQKQTDRLLSILKWPSAVLQSRMQGFTAFCLLGSLCCSSFIVIGHVTGFEFARHIGLPLAVIVFLILTVAGRTIQDGLAAPEELQRYNDYLGKVRYLLSRFEASNDVAQKLELMVEMERAALEELKGFLRAHFDARFVI